MAKSRWMCRTPALASPWKNKSAFLNGFTEVMTPLLWQPPGQAWAWRSRRPWLRCITGVYGCPAAACEEKAALSPLLSQYKKSRKVRPEMTKILIAEDEPDIRDLVKFTLTFAGYTVVAVTNG